MDLVRGVAFPFGWLLGGALAVLAVVEPVWAWVGFVVLGGTLWIPDEIRFRKRRQRLGLFGVPQRLPAGFGRADALAPAVFLIIALAAAVGFGTAWGIAPNAQFTSSARWIVLISVGLMGLLSLALLAASLVAERRSLRRLARGRGWMVVPEAPDLPRDLTYVEPVRWGQAPRETALQIGPSKIRYAHHARNVLSGQISGVPFRAFEYTYEDWQPAKEGGRAKHSRRTHRVVAASMPDPAPDLIIRALDARLATVDGPPDVLVAPSPFSAMFSVQCDDPEFVYEWMTQGVVEVLMALGPDYGLNWNGNVLSLHAAGHLEGADALLMVSALSQIVRMMPLSTHPAKAFVQSGAKAPARKAFQPTGPQFKIRNPPPPGR